MLRAWAIYLTGCVLILLILYVTHHGIDHNPLVIAWGIVGGGLVRNSVRR